MTEIDKRKIASQNKRRGRKAEKDIQKRIPGALGIGALGGEDIYHPLFSFEVKSRKTFEAANWMDQAVRNCLSYKTPALIVHVRGKRHDKNLVIMLQKDFEDFLGGIKNAGGDDRSKLSKPPMLKPIIR